jgi:hypothetical protein
MMIRYSHKLGINKITILFRYHKLGINNKNERINFHLSFLKFQVLCKIVLGFVESLTSFH